MDLDWRGNGKDLEEFEEIVIRVDCMEKTIFDKRKVDKMKIPTGPSIEAFWEPNRLWFIILPSLSWRSSAYSREISHKKTWITDYLLK